MPRLQPNSSVLASTRRQGFASPGCARQPALDPAPRRLARANGGSGLGEHTRVSFDECQGYGLHLASDARQAGLSVSSQFDGPMITIDDGVWPSLSVIGDGSSANGDIAIKLSDVHQNHDHKRRQR